MYETYAVFVPAAGARSEHAPSAVQQAAAAAGKTLLNATAIDELWPGFQQRAAAHFTANYRKLVDRPTA